MAKAKNSKEQKEFDEKYKARSAKLLADWLADHPEKTAEDAEIAGTCGDTPEGEAAWGDWCIKRYGGRDPLDTPSGPQTAEVLGEIAAGRMGDSCMMRELAKEQPEVEESDDDLTPKEKLENAKSSLVIYAGTAAGYAEKFFDIHQENPKALTKSAIEEVRRAVQEWALVADQIGVHIVGDDDEPAMAAKIVMRFARNARRF